MNTHNILPLGRPPGMPPGMPLGAPPSAPPKAPPMPPHGAAPGGAFGAPPASAPPGALPLHPPPAYPPPGAAAPYGAPPHYAPPPGMPPGEPIPPTSPYPGEPYSQPPYGSAPAAPLSPVTRTGRSPLLVVVAVLGGLILLGVIGYIARYATLSPSVSKIEFAHNFQDNRAVDVTDTFKSTDANLYAIIHLNTTKGTPNVNVVWTVVSGTDAAKRPVAGLEFGQAERAATNTLLSASVARGTSPWPIGQYKIDVFLDGKLAKTAQFTITA